LGEKKYVKTALFFIMGLNFFLMVANILKELAKWWKRKQRFGWKVQHLHAFIPPTPHLSHAE
jgi:hypothetical protein